MQAAPTRAMIEKAAEWAAVLDDDAALKSEREACEAWCLEHPLHRLAFDRVAPPQPPLPATFCCRGLTRSRGNSCIKAGF